MDLDFVLRAVRHARRAALAMVTLTLSTGAALSDEAFVAPATAREIAADLVVTEAAVKQHLLRLYQKFRISGGLNRRIRLAGEGDSGARGGPRGDLYLFISVKPHELFERDGLDLLCTVPVPMYWHFNPAGVGYWI